MLRSTRLVSGKHVRQMKSKNGHRHVHLNGKEFQVERVFSLAFTSWRLGITWEATPSERSISCTVKHNKKKAIVPINRIENIYIMINDFTMHFS